eukprot:TRINITY_DN22615_c0_g1_i1.p1 TRINITY_DN22615_c0_g1~~TRINITY_DN22615_c0_g1_i1.p1  ORF type:complete len:273 (-),score=88.34 TRINITY_DN22615_c0_g1_i1:18-836(-)
MNGDVSQGITVVTKAVVSDNAGDRGTALQLYNQAIALFRKGQSASDGNMQKMLDEKIQMYQKRVRELEVLELSSTINKKGQTTAADDSLFKDALGEAPVTTDDQLLQDRIAKLKMASKPVPTIGPENDDQMRDRLAKLSNGRFGGNQKMDLDSMRDPTEEEQLAAIINAAHDSIALDAMTPDHLKDQDEEEEKKKKKKKTSKKKKKHRKYDSDSDSESSSDSEDVDVMKDLQIRESDDPLQRREKLAMQRMFLAEKEKEAKAFEEWKKKNRF